MARRRSVAPENHNFGNQMYSGADEFIRSAFYLRDIVCATSLAPNRLRLCLDSR
jgi:hypothetical protein